MTPAEKKHVRNDVEHEGMHYTFISYDDCAEIGDPKFHALRLVYLQAAKKLLDYVGYEGEPG